MLEKGLQADKGGRTGKDHEKQCCWLQTSSFLGQEPTGERVGPTYRSASRRNSGKPELRNVFSWLAFPFAVAADGQGGPPSYPPVSILAMDVNLGLLGKGKTLSLSEHLEFFPPLKQSDGSAGLRELGLLGSGPTTLLTFSCDLSYKSLFFSVWFKKSHSQHGKGHPALCLGPMAGDSGQGSGILTKSSYYLVALMLGPFLALHHLIPQQFLKTRQYLKPIYRQDNCAQRC